jgi:hypothetical protein
MTRSTLGLSVAVLIGLAAGWFAASAFSPDTPLRSAHSQPARGTSPAPVVVVTAEGKVFHRDGCTFIHGPAVSESAEQAIARGYTPCTRCLPR